MNRLKDKVAVVTGGGAGIGRATCELFAEEGAAVVVAERNAESGREVAQQITAQGGRAQFVPTDVADEASVQRMVAEAVRVFGRIHCKIIDGTEHADSCDAIRNRRMTVTGRCGKDEHFDCRSLGQTFPSKPQSDAQEQGKATEQ